MTWLLAITTMSAFAQQATVTGPDSFLRVNVSVKQGIPVYSVTYKDKTILEDSPLGFIANVGDFSRDMTFTGQKENKIIVVLRIYRISRKKRVPVVYARCASVRSGRFLR